MRNARDTGDIGGGLSAAPTTPPAGDSLGRVADTDEQPLTCAECGRRPRDGDEAGFATPGRSRSRSRFRQAGGAHDSLARARLARSAVRHARAAQRLGRGTESQGFGSSEALAGKAAREHRDVIRKSCFCEELL